MRYWTKRASAVVLGTATFAALVSADSGVAARDLVPALMITEPQPEFVSEPVIQSLSQENSADSAAEDTASPENRETAAAESLAELVEYQSNEPLSRELNCLAGAIYFESKGEPLTGQLAVGRVIVARSRSGRFPNSYCGVVYQPSQFSFVRGRTMPKIDRSSRAWTLATAIARIADAGTWKSPMEGALFFHAAHVSPRWRLTRLGRLENHVFYR